MKRTLFVLCIIIGSVLHAATINAKGLSDESLYEQALSARMIVLERAHGIKFDPQWRPRVVFSDGSLNTSVIIPEWEMAFVVKTGTFKLRTRYRDVSINLDDFRTLTFVSKPELSFIDILRKNIDHELGHALTSQIGLRYTGKIWPDPYVDQKANKYAMIWEELVSEGTATYFEQTSDIDKIKCGQDRYWPININQPPGGITYNDVFYKGGYCLVEPIIRLYGEKGILYLITHPMKMRGNDLRQAASEYQIEALLELSK